jgi:hypothetical protein
VKRLLSWLMILALVLGYGSSVSAAICQHRDLGGHEAARQSLDRKVAASALTEEAAAATGAKKGSTSASPVGSPIDMVAPAAPVVPLRVAEPILRPLEDSPALAGISVRPPLPPPLG